MPTAADTLIRKLILPVVQECNRVCTLRLHVKVAGQHDVDRKGVVELGHMDARRFPARRRALQRWGCLEYLAIGDVDAGPQRFVMRLVGWTVALIAASKQKAVAAEKNPIHIRTPPTFTQAAPFPVIVHFQGRPVHKFERDILPSRVVSYRGWGIIAHSRMLLNSQTIQIAKIYDALVVVQIEGTQSGQEAMTARSQRFTRVKHPMPR